MTVKGGEPALEPALWSSGIVQNVAFLLMLLGRLPDVELAAVVACPAGTSHPLGARLGLPVVGEDEVAGRLDVLVELGARGATAAMDAFRRAGGRIVSYLAGNALAMNFEAVACAVPHGEIMAEAPFDAVWITPQHWRMNASYAAMTRSPRVEIAPHIWSPVLLEQSAASAGQPLFWKRRPPGAPVRIGIFDPNVNVLKTFHIPLLAADMAFRQRTEAIDRVLMFSAAHLKGNAHFEEFCAATDLMRHGRLFAESRFPLAHLLGLHIDLVVTHQWENSLNYLYWDVLFAGYPIVHNSPHLGACGYSYRDFDPADGGRAILDAVARHGADPEHERRCAMETVWAYHIDNPGVQARYAELLASVMDAA